MPYLVAYTLPTASSVPSVLVPGPSFVNFTSGTPVADVIAHDSTYFLGLLNSSFPVDYVAGLKQSQSSGYVHFESFAAVGERVSAAIANSEVDSFVITARGGSKATGTVEIWKTSALAYTLKAGCTFSTRDGKLFSTLDPIVFDGSNNGPFSVRITAAANGYMFNVPGQLVAKNGDIVPGAIINVDKWVTSVPVYDNTLAFRQVLPTTGGTDDALSLVGGDLGIPRVLNEETEAYRLRIKDAPDTVSRGAIERAVTRFIHGLNPSYSVSVREIGTGDFPGLVYDAGSSMDSPQVPEFNFAYDLNVFAQPEDRYKLLVDEYSRRGFFIVVLPKIEEVTSFGAIYDVGPSYAPDFASAYDTTLPDVNSCANDGKSTYNKARYEALHRLLSQKIAAGVGFELVHPTTTVLV